jgi:arginyl-tRNA synthetase
VPLAPQGAQYPLIVQKTDGGFGYASTDMAASERLPVPLPSA